MNLKKILKIFFIIFVIIIASFFIFKKFFKKNETIRSNPDLPEETISNSNIIENVNYSSKDTQGNEYIINASKGEIDYSNSNILYLTNVYAIIKLKNSEKITISSKYGKYNSDNYDTIFSKNVIIKYLDNKITGGYLDFSLERNLMIISKKVTYNNSNNTLKADVIEMNLKTKDTKIFMYETNKKVNIKSLN
tara:strand:- start:703 stop:1278 length:576 start_codon:yes stop_codon:yes gene_type:complete